MDTKLSLIGYLYLVSYQVADLIPTFKYHDKDILVTALCMLYFTRIVVLTKDQ